MTVLNSEHVLRTLLRQEPRPTLDQIRAAHPIFQTKSLDHLNVRIALAMEREPELRTH